MDNHELARRIMEYKPEVMTGLSKLICGLGPEQPWNQKMVKWSLGIGCHGEES